VFGLATKESKPHGHVTVVRGKSRGDE